MAIRRSGVTDVVVPLSSKKGHIHLSVLMKAGHVKPSQWAISEVFFWEKKMNTLCLLALNLECAVHRHWGILPDWPRLQYSAPFSQCPQSFVLRSQWYHHCNTLNKPKCSRMIAVGASDESLTCNRDSSLSTVKPQA